MIASETAHGQPVSMPFAVADIDVHVRVLIEHPVMRVGWESILTALPHVHVSRGDAVDGTGPPQQETGTLTFLDLDDWGGRDVLATMLASSTEPLVVAVTKEQSPHVLPHAISGTVRAVVSPGDPVDDIRAAISAAAQGHLWISASLREALTLPGEDVCPQAGELTERELEMARMLLVGATNAEIAEVHGISVSTVKYHVSNLMRKLGVARRSQIARALNRF